MKSDIETVQDVKKLIQFILKSKRNLENPISYIELNKVFDNMNNVIDEYDDIESAYVDILNSFPKIAFILYDYIESQYTEDGRLLQIAKNSFNRYADKSKYVFDPTIVGSEDRSVLMYREQLNNIPRYLYHDTQFDIENIETLLKHGFHQPKHNGSYVYLGTLYNDYQKKFPHDEKKFTWHEKNGVVLKIDTEKIDKSKLFFNARGCGMMSFVYTGAISPLSIVDVKPHHLEKVKKQRVVK